jgi:dihydropteroate synthase
VTGLTGDPDMLRVAVQTQSGVCIMHMQGTPQTMQDNPTYRDIVGEIYEYLRDRRDVLLAAGIAPDRICLDPGIGFGKTNDHNITLMSHVSQFHQLGCPLLVGHSRKAFLGKLIGNPGADRSAATMGAACALAEQGVQIVRVHEVSAVRHALLAFAACRSAIDD